MIILSRSKVLGYSILNETAERVATATCDELNSNYPKAFIFLNPHSVVECEREPELRKAVSCAYGIFCDGVGLALAALLLTRRRTIRVYGYEFFTALSRALSARRIGKVFFLGGTEDSLKSLVDRYRTEFPGIASVDSYAPPYRTEFRPSEVDEMANRISDSGADILWVGLGSPKQEKILSQLMQKCSLSCGAAVGAVFDFYTGKVPHAPVWIRKMGLQWAHRLVLEPKRLWRRTLISTPVFLWLVLRAFSRKTDSNQADT